MCFRPGSRCGQAVNAKKSKGQDEILLANTAKFEMSGFSGMGIVERWNGGMDFFLACLCTNYCQEYITLKQRSTIPCIGKKWLGRVDIPTIILLL